MMLGKPKLPSAGNVARVLAMMMDETDSPFTSVVGDFDQNSTLLSRKEGTASSTLHRQNAYEEVLGSSRP
jgi:hypothetical protein